MSEEKKKSDKVGKFIFNKHKGIKLTVGTMNHKQCSAVFIAFGTWIRPKESLKETIRVYQEHVRYIVKKLKEEHFGNECNVIRDIQYSESNMKTNKKRVDENFTFMSVEVTFLFTKLQNFSDKSFNSKFSVIGSCLIDDLLSSDTMDIQLTRKG